MDIAKKTMAALLVGLLSTSSAFAGDVGRWESASSTQRESLLASMGSQIRLALGKSKPLQGQVLPATTHVVVSGTEVSVELGRRFIPIGTKDFTPDLQRQLQELTSSVIDEAKRIGLQPTTIEYTFDGKTISDIFPDDFPNTISR